MSECTYGKMAKFIHAVFKNARTQLMCDNHDRTCAQCQSGGRCALERALRTAYVLNPTVGALHEYYSHAQSCCTCPPSLRVHGSDWLNSRKDLFGPNPPLVNN